MDLHSMVLSRIRRAFPFKLLVYYIVLTYHVTVHYYTIARRFLRHHTLYNWFSYGFNKKYILN
jgi:hypothetical protein